MEPIAATLEKVVSGSLKRANAGSNADTAVLAWPLACGSAVAERTRAVSFRAGVLWVEVPDAGWRAELAYLAPQYVLAINKYSAASVERIEFVTAPDAGRTQK